MSDGVDIAAVHSRTHGASAEPAPKPAAPQKPKPGGSQAISDASYAAAQRRTDKRKLTIAAPAKVIIPANIKRTVAATPLARFAVDLAHSTL